MFALEPLLEVGRSGAVGSGKVGERDEVAAVDGGVFGLEPESKVARVVAVSLDAECGSIALVGAIGERTRVCGA